MNSSSSTATLISAAAPRVATNCGTPELSNVVTTLARIASCFCGEAVPWIDAGLVRSALALRAAARGASDDERVRSL